MPTRRTAVSLALMLLLQAGCHSVQSSRSSGLDQTGRDENRCRANQYSPVSSGPAETHRILAGIRQRAEREHQEDPGGRSKTFAYCGVASKSVEQDGCGRLVGVLSDRQDLSRRVPGTRTGGHQAVRRGFLCIARSRQSRGRLMGTSCDHPHTGRTLCRQVLLGLGRSRTGQCSR